MTSYLVTGTVHTVYYALVFLIFLGCLFFMTRMSSKKYSIVRILLSAFLMTLTALAIRILLYPYFSFIFGLLFNFVYVFGINPPLAMAGREIGIGEWTVIYSVLFCAFLIPNLLLQYWIPFFIFPGISRKKIFFWVFISVVIVSFVNIMPIYKLLVLMHIV